MEDPHAAEFDAFMARSYPPEPPIIDARRLRFVDRVKSLSVVQALMLILLFGAVMPWVIIIGGLALAGAVDALMGK